MNQVHLNKIVNNRGCKQLHSLYSNMKDLVYLIKCVMNCEHIPKINNYFINNIYLVENYDKERFKFLFTGN